MIQNSVQSEVQLLHICYQMFTWKKFLNESGLMTSGQYPGSSRDGKVVPFERSQDIYAVGSHTDLSLKVSVNPNFAEQFLNTPVPLIFFLTVPTWGFGCIIQINYSA